MKFLTPIIMEDVVIQFVDTKQFIKDLIAKKKLELQELIKLEYYESCAIIRDKIDNLELELTKY